MKKLFFLLMVLVVTACSGVDSGKRFVKIGLTHSKNHSYTRALERIAEEVEEKTNGTIEVKIYHSSRLGSEKEMQEMLTIGSLDMSVTGLLSNYNPLFAIFEMPYLYRDRKHVYSVFTGEAFKDLVSTIEPYGITVPGFYENGFRNITNSIKPINSPEDLDGLMIRVPENPAYVATMEALGALPVTLSFSELYTALLQGVADGQENPLQNIWFGRFYEAQEYLAKTQHVYNAAYLIAGTKFWDKLTPDDRSIFQTAINNSVKWQLSQMEQLDIEFEKKLKNEGMKFTYPDLSAFARAAAPAYETMYASLGSDAKKLVGQIKMAGKQQHAKVLYINSYHAEYPPASDVTRAVEATLKVNSIPFKTLFLDTKRNSEQKYIERKIDEIRKEIELYKPNLLIAADDNVIKYLIEPYYKNSKLPVVFCGVNWTCNQYGLPTQNVTGMLEVLPLEETIRTVREYYPKSKKMLVLSENTTSERSNSKILAALYQELDLEVDYALVDDFEEWKNAFKKANDLYDLIYLPTNGAIKNWNEKEAKEFVQSAIKKPVITCDDFMMKYAVFGLTKIAAEQGEWASQTAVDILNGKSPSEIAVTKNTETNAWLNKVLASKIGFQPNKEILSKCQLVN